MDIDTARDKYGSEYVGDDEEVHWSPNYNKVRGMVVRYAHAKDCIYCQSEAHSASEYVDDVWEWLGEKLGDGFHAVFESDEPSPSGEFDRVTKNKLESVIEGLYENNEDYVDVFDEKVEVVDDEDSYGNGCDETPRKIDEDTTIHESVRILYKGDMGRFPSRAPSHAEPDVDSYKYNMKEFAKDVDGIPSSDDSPSAEEFVRCWLSYLDEFVLSGVGHVCMEFLSGSTANWTVTGMDEIVQWSKEMWSDDDEFRSIVCEKWGDDIGIEEESDNKGHGFDTMSIDSSDNTESNKKEKTLSDFA